MCKILIIGPPCAGKSSLAKKLSEELRIERYELDDYYWKENWKRQPQKLFEKAVAEIVLKPTWIIDGYYSEANIQLKDSSDIIIVIKKSISVLAVRLILRSTYRVLFRIKVCGNNIENFRFLFSTDGLLRHAWRQYLLYEKEWYKQAFCNNKIIIIRQKREEEELIEKIKSAYSLISENIIQDK